MQGLETFELRDGLHDGALAAHEAGRHLAVASAGLLTLGATAGGFALTGGDATTLAGRASVLIDF